VSKVVKGIMSICVVISRYLRKLADSNDCYTNSAEMRESISENNPIFSRPALKNEAPPASTSNTQTAESAPDNNLHPRDEGSRRSQSSPGNLVSCPT
jgi:hypothetical protein